MEGVVDGVSRVKGAGVDTMRLAVDAEGTATRGFLGREREGVSALESGSELEAVIDTVFAAVWRGDGGGATRDLSVDDEWRWGWGMETVMEMGVMATLEISYEARNPAMVQVFQQFYLQQ